MDDCKKNDWTQKQLQEIISHQISLFGVIQLFGSIKKKKFHFFIRMRPSFREKPRENEVIHSLKLINDFNVQNLCLYSIYKYSIVQL